MAKSRSLIPFASIMILSLTAAVTSTFAWFTANRDLIVNAGSISIINPKGRLSVEAFEGAGTTIENENDAFVKVQHHGKFTDGSIDLAKNRVFTSNLDLNGQLVQGKEYRVISSNSQTGANGGYIDSWSKCHVVQNYTLKFHFGDKDTDKGVYGLFFDGEQYNGDDVYDGSGIISGDASSQDESHVARGLRVALISDVKGQNNKESKTLIYGPSLYTTLKSNGVLDHVTSIGDLNDYSNQTSKFDESLIAEKVRMPDNSYVTQGQGKNFIGDFILDGIENVNGDTLTVKVWIWFEGCDTKNVSTKAIIDIPITMRLNFNVMPLKINKG